MSISKAIRDALQKVVPTQIRNDKRRNVQLFLVGNFPLGRRVGNIDICQLYGNLPKIFRI